MDNFLVLMISLASVHARSLPELSGKNAAPFLQSGLTRIVTVQDYQVIAARDASSSIPDVLPLHVEAEGVAPRRVIPESFNYPPSQVGHFQVLNCDAKRTQKLKIAISDITDHLPDLISEVETKGAKSLYGFSAFFDKADSAPHVSDMYQDILREGPRSLPDINGTTTLPYFICSTPTMPQIANVNQADLELANGEQFCGGKQPFRYVAHFDDGWTLLCDKFFRSPQSPKTCPNVPSSLASIPSWKTLDYSIYGNVIHTLTLFYLGYTTLRPDYHDPRICIKLTAADALRNARNYELLANGNLICRTL